MTEALIAHNLEEERARLTPVDDTMLMRPVVEEIPHPLSRDGVFPGDQAGRMAHGYPEQGEEKQPSDSRLNGPSYLSDVLDAQQILISAQHQYLHDNDPAKLLRAQLHVIGVYNGVLDRLGVFG